MQIQLRSASHLSADIRLISRSTNNRSRCISVQAFLLSVLKLIIKVDVHILPDADSPQLNGIFVFEYA